MTPLSVPQLIQRQRDGFSLEQPFYTDARIFELEIRTLLAQEWLLVDHESRIPESGDYFLFNVGGESLIIVRDHAGEIRALFNVCRHRGSKVCNAAEGHSRSFTCPYHGWTYELDGRLKRWRHMSGELSAEDFGLATAHVRLLEGLIFVSLAPGAAPDFESIRGLAMPMLQVHGVAGARVAHRETYLIRGNWKLALENFHECYHCPSSHPQYTGVYAYVSAQERASEDATLDFQQLTSEWREAARRLNDLPDLGQEIQTTRSGGRVYRAPIRRGFETGSPDGRAVAPLMGKFRQLDGGHTGITFNYLSGMAGYGDHAVALRFTPLSVLETDATICWLVHADAVEGRDYERSRLTWLWDITTRQDQEIIERNALGVHSSRYVPGPYSELEPCTRDFVRWYLSRMAAIQSGQI